MTYKEVYDELIKNKDETKTTDLEWLFLEVFKITKSDFLINQNKLANDDELNKFIELREKYLNHNFPVQQLVGHAYFYGEKFLVNSDTLIPRKETEILVEEVIKTIKNNYQNYQDLKILDLGTGSGIIGITLAKELGLKVILTDINRKALIVANKNAKLHNVDVKILESNWFSNLTDKYDVIISNPPYIESNYELDKKVLKEPTNALFGGLDGLEAYVSILKDIKKHLNDKFIIAFEHGYNQSESLITLVNKYLNNIKIKVVKDYQGLKRHLIIESDNYEN